MSSCSSTEQEALGAAVRSDGCRRGGALMLTKPDKLDVHVERIYTRGECHDRGRHICRDSGR